MLASIPTFMPEGTPIHIDVHITPGLPGLNIVGLANNNTREVRDRVRAALINRGLPWPNRLITVQIASTLVTRWCSGWDLALAIGILDAAAGIVTVRECPVWGELALDGHVRPVQLNIALGDLPQG